GRFLNSLIQSFQFKLGHGATRRTRKRRPLRTPPTHHSRLRLGALEDRIAPDGSSVAWVRQFAGIEPSGDEIAYSAANDGNIYIAGGAYSPAVVPGQPAATDDAFVRKYDAAGTLLWERQLASPGYDQAYGVAASASGVYVAGYTNNTLPGQTSAGGDDAYVAKYDTAGNLLWVRQFGSAGSDQANAVAADATGVYVVGSTTGTLPGQT